MAEAAIAHLAPLARVDRVEERLGGTSYTIDTVRALLAAEPELSPVLMVGADAYAERARWRSWDALSELVELFVLGREGEPDPPDVPVRVHLPDVSSSDVRRRVREGQPFEHLVPRSVARIIAERGLYRS